MQHQQQMQMAIDAQDWDLPWKVLGNPSDIPKAEKSPGRGNHCYNFHTCLYCDWLVWDLPVYPRNRRMSEWILSFW